MMRRVFHRIVGRLKAQVVSGASLVEVTVSMVLLSIIFGAAWMIFGQVVASGNQRLRRTAEAQAEAWLDTSLQEKTYLSDTRSLDWGRLNREVTLHADFPGLVNVEVIAIRADGRILSKVNQWVYVVE